MAFPNGHKGDADMDEVRRIVSILNGYGFIDAEIARALGYSSRIPVYKWRHSVCGTFSENQERLTLLLDAFDVINSTFGPECKSEYLRTFLYTNHSTLSGSSPEQYMLLHGTSAREEIILAAKSYAERLKRRLNATGSLADVGYVLAHVRLDLEILQKYHLDKFDLAEIINKDRHRIDELLTGKQKQSQPTRLEAHQLRQAAATAIALGQLHDPRAVKGLMSASGDTYLRRYKYKIKHPDSIIDVIGAQVEGDYSSHERAALKLGQILSVMTGKA